MGGVLEQQVADADVIGRFEAYLKKYPSTATREIIFYRESYYRRELVSEMRAKTPAGVAYLDVLRDMYQRPSLEDAIMENPEVNLANDLSRMLDLILHDSFDPPDELQVHDNLRKLVFYESNHPTLGLKKVKEAICPMIQWSFEAPRLRELQAEMKKRSVWDELLKDPITYIWLAFDVGVAHIGGKYLGLPGVFLGGLLGYVPFFVYQKRNADRDSKRYTLTLPIRFQEEAIRIAGTYYSLPKEIWRRAAEKTINQKRELLQEKHLL